MGFEWKAIQFKKLRLETEYDDSIPDPLRYNPSNYAMHKTHVFTPKAMQALVALHPMYVIRKDSYYNIVAGKRVFHIAALCHAPSTKLTVGILDRHTPPEFLNFLRYMDQVVTPLIFRTESTLAEIYSGVNIPELRQQAWLEELASTMSAFAAALNVSPAALVKPAGRSNKKAKNTSADDILGEKP